MERRLAAILAADVVGYTRMMSHDEAGTLQSLSTLIKNIITPLIESHNGRIVKLMGDGVLAEFGSVIDACACAVSWQEQIPVGDEATIAFRIGINLGDIIIQDDDIFGQGVNIAARLEGLADPGGVCISDDVFRQIKGKLDTVFEDMGPQHLKNVEGDVRTHRWVNGSQPITGPSPSLAPGDGRDRLSIAVLPFENMSGDPQQEYFSDGISEDIITELSRFSELFVIARNSSFLFKEQRVPSKQVASKLGIQYLVEGSVRKAGNRVRISAQLIDAHADNQLWADRFDRSLEDIFEVQDEVVRSIVAVLPGRIAEADMRKSGRKPVSDLNAYDHLLRGNFLLAKRGNNIKSAISHYRLAVEIDPELAAAHSGIAIAEGMSVWDLSTYDDDPLDRAYQSAKRALELDSNDYRAHAAFGEATRQLGQHSIAHSHLQRAMKLNPNSAQVLGYWAMLQAYTGDPEGAIETYHKAAQLDPFSQDNLRKEILAESYYNLREYQKSIDVLESMLTLPIFYVHQQIAIAYAQQGNHQASARHLQSYRTSLPDRYDEHLLFESHLRLCALESNREHWVEGYGLIGLEPRSAQEAVPAKPTVAVLPFTNMSGDAEQDYFSDGMSEDIITELSRFQTLSVISRKSSFAFRNAELDIKEIAEQLGAQYVVEGSVRRAGNRLRITAQLIDVETGKHIWAERYDRDLEDIFAVQDDVTQSIVAILPGRVQSDVASRASRKPTNNMKAYELMLRGKTLRDSLNAEDTARARELFERALKLDPSYARAYMYLADTYVVDHWLGLSDDNGADMALQLARKGAALDNKDVFIQDQLGFAHLCAGLWQDAEVQFDKTLSQIVNEAESMAWCGYGFMMLVQPQKALEILERATKLDPLHPPALDWILGQIYFFCGRYGDVIRVLIGEAMLNSLSHAFLTCAYAELGRTAEAQDALGGFITQRKQEFASRNLPVNDDSLQSLAGSFHKLWCRQEDWDRLTEGLRKAGLKD